MEAKMKMKTKDEDIHLETSNSLGLRGRGVLVLTPWVLSDSQRGISYHLVNCSYQTGYQRVMPLVSALLNNSDTLSELQTLFCWKPKVIIWPRWSFWDRNQSFQFLVEQNVWILMVLPFVWIVALLALQAYTTCVGAARHAAIASESPSIAKILWLFVYLYSLLLLLSR